MGAIQITQKNPAMRLARPSLIYLDYTQWQSFYTRPALSQD